MELLGKCARPLAPLMYLIMPWLSAIAFFMQTLDAAILNTALPAMAWELQVSPLNMQSAIISYSMTLAICIPISGFLSDRWGQGGFSSCRCCYLHLVHSFVPWPKPCCY